MWQRCGSFEGSKHDKVIPWGDLQSGPPFSVGVMAWRDAEVGLAPCHRRSACRRGQRPGTGVTHVQNLMRPVYVVLCLLSLSVPAVSVGRGTMT